MRAILLAITLCLATIANAVEQTPTVFYPLPTQAQGKVFAAKELFLANGGGVWFQDVRNQIMFFDGQDIMPRSGSALEHDVEQVAYLDNAFWSFFRNEIYRTVPNQEKELVFSLKPGTEIKRIGASKRFIWLSDNARFYTYNVDTGEFLTYSLLELYKYSQSSTIQINDAKFVLSKWVVATNAGVYLSNESNFVHVASSGQNYVEKIYFSDSRRELVIGSLKGALIFDIQNPQRPTKYIPGSHVLSITETSEEYWIGTENGLLVYSFLTGETKRLISSGVHDNSVIQGKIYALLNDQAGGIWIATDSGVRYFSLFSHKFERVSGRVLTPNIDIDKPKLMLRKESSEGYWMVSDSGIYSVTLAPFQNRRLMYRGTVSDFAESDGVLWLATNQGVRRIDNVTGHAIDDKPMPEFLKTADVRFLQMGKNEVLWGAGDDHLWRYDLKNDQLTQYGSDWMIKKYLPAQLTDMQVTEQGFVILGTEHGAYVLRNGQIHFIGESVPFGSVINSVQVDDHDIWVASRYGLYRFDLYTGHVKPLPLLDGHITPKCLIGNQDGMWLTSSAGLTRYSENGYLLRHYGEPFGLISNEFTAGQCSYGAGDERTLLFGTHFNLIKVSTQELVVSKLPDVRVIISQVKVNQTLESLGATIRSQPEINYGESIAFKFGVLPRVNKVSVEYRLNDDEWQLLDGSTLNIEHLMPGDYQLEVRAVLNNMQRGRSNTFEFSVSQPWFMTPYAIIAYFAGVIIFIAAIVYWRSRIMNQANRDLKAQVALKTNQLRHQSRILLTNNQQLRKQLQIRRLIANKSIKAMKQRLESSSVSSVVQQSEASQKVISYLLQELDLLLHVRTTDGEAKPVYNLTLILKSVLSGWADELEKANINIELESDSKRDYFVSLSSFNLDELLNLLVDSVVRRCYRNQTVVLSTRLDDKRVVLTLMDQGESLESYNHSSLLQNIGSLIEQSGGCCNIHSSAERNLMEVSWVASDNFDEASIIDIEPFDYHELKPSEDPWLEKVKQLVFSHYSDPELSTSTAAKMLYVSERSLQRRLKTAIDKTFTEYLTEVRLDNACRRLLAGEKVSDVAFECGFNDPSYFSQRFKHRFGMSPTQFVEEKES